jgi:hypothetical protein
MDDSCKVSRIDTTGSAPDRAPGDGPAPRAEANRPPRNDVWSQLLERSSARGASDAPPATIRGLYLGTVPPKSDAHPTLVTLPGDDAGDEASLPAPAVVIPEPPPTRGRRGSSRSRIAALVGGLVLAASLSLHLLRRSAPSEPPPLPPLGDSGSHAASPR